MRADIETMIAVVEQRQIDLILERLGSSDDD